MANSTAGTSVSLISADQLASMVANQTLLLDNRRQRPQYFDGRFLAAKDLNREQRYFLTRQADLAQTLGFGVGQGLAVSLATESDSTRLKITPGYGITPKGELVVLPELEEPQTYTVSLQDIPFIQKLDAAFGLSPLPRESPQNLTGLYVLGLRAVQFTTNTMTAYPTTVGGTAARYDGDIVDAIALTLIPYTEDNPGLTWQERRAEVAHHIFVNDGGPRTPANVLPVAMLALNNGLVQWIDPFMVRREIGHHSPQILGLSSVPQALRFASFHQYCDHLQQVFNATLSKSAAAYFRALPAAGKFPREAVDIPNLAQSFFSPQIKVDIAFVPPDEIPILLQESVSLPPIDLMASPSELGTISVLILVPAENAINSSVSVRELSSAANVNKIRRQQPERLWQLNLMTQDTNVSNSADDSTLNLQQVLRSTQEDWWYIRKQIAGGSSPITVAAQSPGPSLSALEINSAPAAVTRIEGGSSRSAVEAVSEPPSSPIDEELDEKLEQYQILTLVDEVEEKLSRAAKTNLYTVLRTPRFYESELMMRVLLEDLRRVEVKDQKILSTKVTEITEKYTAPEDSWPEIYRLGQAADKELMKSSLASILAADLNTLRTLEIFCQNMAVLDPLIDLAKRSVFSDSELMMRGLLKTLLTLEPKNQELIESALKMVDKKYRKNFSVKGIQRLEKAAAEKIIDPTLVDILMADIACVNKVNEVGNKISNFDVSEFVEGLLDIATGDAEIDKRIDKVKQFLDGVLTNLEGAKS